MREGSLTLTPTLTRCEKVEDLLRDALAHGELDIKMATACSGTDAPVVAMRVAKEQLARRGVELPFEHVMSCEIEPYKQARPARLRPNITLTPHTHSSTPAPAPATTSTSPRPVLSYPVVHRAQQPGRAALPRRCRARGDAARPKGGARPSPAPHLQPPP